MRFTCGFAARKNEGSGSACGRICRLNALPRRALFMDSTTIRAHVPALDRISRERARLENADSPEPLIESHRSVNAQNPRS